MKITHYICLSAVAMLGLSSCSDSFLDHNPDERVEIDNPTKVVQLLNSAYPDCNPSWLGEIYSDNLIDNQAPHLPSNPNDKQILAHYNYAQYSLEDNQSWKFEPATQATFSSYDSPGMLWGSYYNSIAYCNFALDAIQKLTAKHSTSEQLRAARGEAELLRAYDHFMLVNYFSTAYRGEASKNDIGVPYVTETENVVNKQYDRSNVYDTYAKIEKDLVAGLADISDLNYTVAPKYHFNVNAAHAFAARFYLFKHDYEKVIEHANAVLGTDSASVQRMTMDYSVFANCSSADDYCTQWQNPSLNNNLMLIPTGSLLTRRAFGYRYSCAGEAARQVYMMHSDLPLKSGYIAPVQAIVGGMVFSRSSSDYGFFSSKIYEKFQYTNKIAGIGYPKVIYRAFTGSELLLERAEAEIMLGRYDAAANDLMAYWNDGLNSFTAADKAAYIATGHGRYLTKAIILSYYGGKSTDNTAILKDWSCAQAMGINIPAAAVPYMNCLNDFRRFENMFEGMRLLDIKRWGLSVTHKVGVNADVIKVDALSPKLNIEVPWESLQSGMQSSRDSNGVVVNGAVGEERQKMAPITTHLTFDRTKFVSKK
ncbi:RagB/SusD family nutrient uptake outer membrane protein [Prevotella lacticifex]|uniref:RagB/SusD family nutrient uptake outer membrane protein n=1 Tax=Prevotella lacticifex TaxID=2854755 RepID=UPI001CC6A92B|nr:RagB/SusD family nutrient uptake outer membrane protein [Prevotella lacticifex]